MPLSEFGRRVITVSWVSICTFVSLWYLSGSFWKSLLAAVFVIGCFQTQLATRWVSRGAFAVTILALAVLFGLPDPQKWAGIASQAENSLRSMISGQDGPVSMTTEAQPSKR